MTFTSVVTNLKVIRLIYFRLNGGELMLMAKLHDVLLQLNLSGEMLRIQLANDTDASSSSKMPLGVIGYAFVQS